MQRITANLPGRVQATLKRHAQIERYRYVSDYGVGLLLWDIYTRQRHSITSPLLAGQRWEIDNFVTDLLREIGDPLADSPEIKSYRYTVTIPQALVPLVELRQLEEHYRSDSAYMMGLVLYSLKFRAPTEKSVAHHKTAAVLREPQMIQDAVFAQLAADFGNPSRVWPAGISGRIDELVIQQRQLPLK